MKCLLLAVSLVLLMVAAPSLTASLPKQELRWGAISNTMEHLSGSLECDACKLGVGVIQDLFSREATEDEIVKAAIEICIITKTEDENVCRLVIPEFKVEVLYVFAHVVLSPEEVCGILLGSGCGKPYDPRHQTWNVTFPATPKPPVATLNPPPVGAPTNRILHLSDMHIDRLYTPGLSNDCGEPLCCRPPNKKGTGKTAAGYWGDYTCDTPLWTIENLLEDLANKSDEFDWVYWTGDLPAHNVWNQSRADQLDILTKCVDLMKKYLPNKRVFPSLGNHESAPVNSFPPPSITGENSNSWLLDAAAEQWDSWLNDPLAKTTVKRGGFYNVLIRPKLRVISLQTNYCNKMNWWLLINATDPAGQLQWLIDQLQAAEDKGERVHIIGHIPPGHGVCIQAWSWNYHKIVDRYESTIVGQFFGHAHSDGLYVHYDEHNTSRATSFVMIGPSVTPKTNRNLGYRIYTIDGDYKESTNGLLDFSVNYLNLTDANLNNNTNWKLEYTASEDYGMKTCYPQDFGDLVNRFETDDALFQKYYHYSYKMHVPHPICDASCKASMMCGMKTSRAHDHSLCDKYLLQADVTTDDVRQFLTDIQSC